MTRAFSDGGPKTVAIVQARLGSTRFPNKVLSKVCGVPLIGLLVKRLLLAHSVDMVVLAVPDDERNEPLLNLADELGIEAFGGSQDDVLDRYYRAAIQTGPPDVVVRVTGDCPLIDPAIVDQIVEFRLQTGVEYASNTIDPTFPDGLDVEAFTFASLARAAEEATSRHDREHVTPYIKNSGNFTVANVHADEDHSSERWTIDEPQDLVVIRAIFERFAPRWDFSSEEVLALLKSEPNLFVANRHLARNEGADLGTGQKLWRRAKRVIPGGNMLLSKRAEMFLPEYWPAYYSSAKGCQVWDLDGNEFTDFSIMGIGTNTLGYGHPEVDEAVLQAVKMGNMSTFNCPEEVELAERLVELHPWADMVRLARTGGEANAISIRLARAASGRERVAFCGYHGWHDWYLSANLGDETQLQGHLLPGLNPGGVPAGLRGTALPFTYNRLDELKEILDNHSDVGVIKMEVSRNHPPQEGFLEGCRELASANGIVLVFDECTSGFRETFGGLHLKYGVEPDLAVFGKALGNGYAITAVVGRRNVMEYAQDTFVSSTFWTERIGPAAAIQTLKVMERERSWESITKVGGEIVGRWMDLANRTGLNLKVAGLPAMAHFVVESENWLKYKTYVTQEMLKLGYLASNTVYACTEHKAEVIDGYFRALTPLFERLARCEQGEDIDRLLDGGVCHSGFTRLN